MQNQPKQDLRIVVVDPEYLVAMEAERVLQDAGFSKTRIAMAWELSSVIAEDGLDLVLIDIGIAASAEVGAVVRRSGAKVVVLSFRSQDLEGVDTWPGAPVVPKPFSDDQILQAIEDAIL